MNDWNDIMKSFINTGGMKAEAAARIPSKRTKRSMVKQNIKPITQRLRNIEMAYALSKAERDTLWQARQLITDLWELHWEPDENFREEVAVLFENAGLELGDGYGTTRDTK